MECVITVELGTNAVRIFAFDLNGNVVASAKGSYPTFHVQPDHSEQDPEQIFITMLYVLKNLITEKLQPQKYAVQSICFIASMHSLLTIDKQGAPIGNAITWADNRGKREAQELKDSDLGKALYHATGTPLHPMSPLVKIAWLKNNDKERFTQASKFLSIKSYILQQLTGEYVIDFSLASATGLLNIHTVQWEADALAFAGIRPAQLPELMSVFGVPGKLRKEYQKLLGLRANTKVMVGSSDGCMATLGAGAWREDKATVTIEDSGAVRVVGRQVLHDDRQRFFNYLLAEDYYISGGPTNNGGVVFEWFAKQFGDFSAPFDTEQIMENLIHEAAHVRPGSDGLLFLPYLLGERAPIWNANARGSYFGLNIKHERQHFIRATIEGILYEVYSIGKILQEHRTIKSLSVNGSFATIPFCAQLMADIFNKPVNMVTNSNSASRGAFLLSAIDMGLYPNFEEAAGSTAYRETLQPREHDHATYGQYFQVFERLSVKLKEEFEVIAELQRVRR
ncbi:gluconokinase [Dawidia soli]|uniref:Gluconokinase n=1 Tax=Dawidia soli TaxID=2782352 RepID=A0AAP2GKL6_9BACT|nr:gluconokinase [Dawidia soli]MBT1689168.1 gluconokinase [Dawidia soli]